MRKIFVTHLTVLLSLLSGTAWAATEFVVFGDIPYNDSDQRLIVEEIGRKSRAGPFPFAINYGDIKGGGESCSNDVLANRLTLLLNVLPGRVVATPGDNDWTDCDRNAAGGFEELERLSHLRGLMKDNAPDDAALGIVRQIPAYWENARWIHEKTVFSTLHVVGTDNGRQAIGDKTEKDLALETVSARDAANLVWLEQAFATARKTGSKALVFTMHHDPTSFKHEDKADKICTSERRRKCNPYKTLMDRLKALSSSSDLPVLLVHGSTSALCLDKEFGGKTAPKLWRLNGPGDFAVLDAAVINVNPTAQVPFRARLLLAGTDVPEDRC